MIFVEIERAISPQSHKDISVLREVLDSPQSCFLRRLIEGGISRGGIKGP